MFRKRRTDPVRLRFCINFRYSLDNTCDRERARAQRPVLSAAETTNLHLPRSAARAASKPPEVFDQTNSLFRRSAQLGFDTSSLICKRSPAHGKTGHELTTHRSFAEHALSSFLYIVY